MSVQKTRRIPLVNLNAIGDNQVAAAIPAQSSPEGRVLQQARKLRIISGLIVAGAAGNVNVSSGLAGGRTDLCGAIPLAISEKLYINPTPDWEFAPFETKAADALNLFTSAAMNLQGFLVVVEVV